MAIRQLSVFAENKNGALYELTKSLAAARIDIRAFSIADTANFGVLRMLVKDSTKAAQVLVNGREPKAKLIGTEQLLAAAMEDVTLRPSQEEVLRWIEQEEAERKRRRKSAHAFPGEGSAKRYIITAGLLFLFSFRTGYAVYYRMLASLCVTVAVLRVYLVRTTHKESMA